MSENAQEESKVAALESLLEKAKIFSGLVGKDLGTTETYPVNASRAKTDYQPSLVSGGTLRSYQRVGVNWLIQLWEQGLNGILADEMGLGKTVQTISLLAHLWEKGVTGPFLIVAPLSTLANWVAEFGKWAPKLPVKLYHGKKDERKEFRKDFNDLATLVKVPSKKQLSHNKKSQKEPPPKKHECPILVTSYDIAIRDKTFLKQYKWKYLVVDEAHRLKNFECKLIKELRAVPALNRLLLTGTPLQNNLSELWSLLNFILPEVFDSLQNFKKWFDFDDIFDSSTKVKGKAKSKSKKRGKAKKSKKLAKKQSPVTIDVDDESQKSNNDQSDKTAESYDEAHKMSENNDDTDDDKNNDDCDDNQNNNKNNESNNNNSSTNENENSNVPSVVVTSIITKLHDVLRPFMLRRLKKDVEKGTIPKKREIVVFCPFQKEQQVWYELIRKRWELKNSATSSILKVSSLQNTLVQLRKTCNHPFLFDEAYDVFTSKFGMLAEGKLRQFSSNIIDKILAQEEKELKEMEEDKNRREGYVSRGNLRKRKRVDYSEEKLLNSIYTNDSDAEESPHKKQKILEESDVPFGNNSDKQLSKLVKELSDEEELVDLVTHSSPTSSSSSSSSSASDTASSVLLEDPGQYLKSMVAHSGKLALLDRMLPLLKKGDHKVLIFSQMTRMLDILQDYTEISGYKCVRIDGSTKQSERQDMIRKFSDEKSDYFIFLLSTRAGGLGINLTAADTVIIYDSDWNPQMDLQAQDRCHRIGQTKPVCVFRLITANSVEGTILAAANRKLRLERLVQKGLQQKKKIEDDDIGTILRQTFAHGQVGSESGETPISDIELALLMDRNRLVTMFQDLDEAEATENNTTTTTTTTTTSTTTATATVSPLKLKRQGFEILEEVEAEF